MSAKPISTEQQTENISTVALGPTQSKCAKIIAIAIMVLATIALCFAFTGWLHVILPVAVVILPLTYCAASVFSKYLSTKQNEGYVSVEAHDESNDTPQLDSSSSSTNQNPSVDVNLKIVKVHDTLKKIGSTELSLTQGDILKLDQHVDVIVNTANSNLTYGLTTSGLNRAIYDAEVLAGSTVIGDELEKLNGCPVGQAVTTNAGSLNAGHVVHVVGPVYSTLNAAQLLYQAYYSSLTSARDLNAKSIAIPSISTGVFAYPLDQAVPIALTAIQDFLLKEKHNFTTIRIVLFDQKTMDGFKKHF